ncbi:MAG: gamma-glutamyl-gamma-aminobutyrate hydrolase family protein [Oscillospiraceae bacterium]|jgi:putative glutamine amidotransferase|nr:gamma-glutamyl-gamma-aminobutyrate hydrolase family protein [Oscillospiraceae bacterium]
MSHPVIGLISSLNSSDPNLQTIKKVVSVNHSYVLSVLGAGGLPLILPPAEQDRTIVEMVRKVDGLLITGGTDLRSQLYGEEPCWNQGPFSPERDHLDFVSIRAAYEQKKPIFGICRGMQAINVYFGGTLYQDLLQEKSCTVKHAQDSEASCWSHTVNISQNSVLYPLLGKSAKVNSFHHQAVKKAADGFTVGAVAKDGVVESIENDRGPLILGVQWHPELMAACGDPAMKKVFNFFIRSCGK